MSATSSRSSSGTSSSRGRSEPYRVCVVCWGNICRSPMGEFLLREAFEDAGLGDRVVVDSAGTSSDELGSGMHPRTAAVLSRNVHPDLGWDEHAARRFERSWFDRYDLVLPVDHVHVERLERLARDDEARATVRLFRSFDPDAVASGELGMDDPWYGTDPAYDQTYAEITAAIPGIVEHVRTALGD
jgi:protein-tyrosine phosphatase